MESSLRFENRTSSTETAALRVRRRSVVRGLGPNGETFRPERVVLLQRFYTRLSSNSPRLLSERRFRFLFFFRFHTRNSFVRHPLKRPYACVRCGRGPIIRCAICFVSSVCVCSGLGTVATGDPRPVSKHYYCFDRNATILFEF